ncbi:MAG: FGGY-family carbohydrate kinase [Clostridia bacterium]
MERLVLSIDCGTQSLRAMVFNNVGELICISKQKYPQSYYALHSGWAEQSIDLYWDSLCRATNDCKTQIGERWNNIICMTVSPMRDTFTCVDKQGNTIRDFILWLDQRRAECKAPLPLKCKVAFRLVGMSEAIDVQRKITKSNWIAENQPQLWKKTYKYMSLGGLLNFKLTGEFKESVAGCIGHIPMQYKERKWKPTSDIQYPIFGIIDHSWLPELVQPDQVIGLVTKKASELTGIKEGLPLISAGSDKGSEAIGLGLIDQNSASLSFGTASTIQFATQKYIEPMTFMPSYPSVAPTLFNPEIQIYRGYWMVNWFLNEFAQKEVNKARELDIPPEEILNEELNNVPVGCEGLMLQPYWAPQLKQPEGKGSIIGFNSVHTKAHLYRAIIEGVGYALYDGYLNLKKRTGNDIKFLTVAGGGSQSDVICQMTADMFGLPVKRIQTYEATGLGGAITGYVAMKDYPDYQTAVASMTHYTSEFIPNLDNHKLYHELYTEVYKQTYPQLQPIYKKLYDILKRD